MLIVLTKLDINIPNNPGNLARLLTVIRPIRAHSS